MCILIRIKSGVNSGQQALEKIQFEGTIAQNLRPSRGWPLVRLLRNNSPQVGLEPTTLRLTEVPPQCYRSLLFITSNTECLGYLGCGVVQPSLVAVHEIQ